jgi:Glycosyl hydrolase family 12
MRRIKPVLYAVAAAALGAACLACGSGSGNGASPGAGGVVPVTTGTAAVGHGAATMCQPYQATDVADGAYTIQDDEWDSKAAQCVSTKGGAAFTVTKSELANPADGNPGSYPSIYAGCNWGACTQGGLAAQPQQLGNLNPGDVTTTLTTTQPSGGAYDVSYDIWLNKTPTAPGAPDGAEVMVWLSHHGGVQPAGDKVASGVKIDGYSYDVWFSTNAGNGPCVTYSMTTAHTDVSDLDLLPLFEDAGNRGYLDPAWYLIAVEAGFEIWQGGQGLAVKDFSVALKNAA